MFMDESQKRFVSLNEVIAILLQGWMMMLHEIAKGEDYCKLSQEGFNNVSTEYLAFYFYYFDRIIYKLFGETKREEAMKEFKVCVIKALEGNDKRVFQMDNKPFKIDAGVGGEFEFFSKYALELNFSTICDERCAEYISCKNLFPIEGDPETMVNNAQLVFSKRISAMVKNNPEDSFCERVVEFTDKYFIFYTKRLKEIGILQTK
jgi:hypothetical protein